MTNSRAWTSIMLVGGPTIALFTHGLIYMTTYESCAKASPLAPHVVAAAGVLALALLAVATTGRLRAHPVHDNAPNSAREKNTRRKFAATAGLAITLLSLLLTLSQWSSIVIFGWCDRT